MNTIEEILRSKNAFEDFKSKKCISCKNKYNKIDLCNITKRIDNTVDCFNYEKCIKNKCKTCEDENNCFKVEQNTIKI